MPAGVTENKSQDVAVGVEVEHITLADCVAGASNTIKSLLVRSAFIMTFEAVLVAIDPNT